MNTHLIDSNIVIQKIKKELSLHRRDRTVLMQECIKKRLDDSFNSYVKELNLDCITLLGKNELKVLNKL